jgi:phosphoglycolate phosphatase
MRNKLFKAIGKTLKELRLDSDLSVKQFAAALGIHRNSVTRMESGETITLPILISVAEYYDVAVSEIILWSETGKPELNKIVKEKEKEMKLLICDFDNTLFSWVNYYVPSFYNMVIHFSYTHGVDFNTIIKELKIVHQKHHDVEHPYALLETPTIQKLFPNQTREEILKAIKLSIFEFQETRKETLKLYPTVKATLRKLQKKGIKLVVHTESKLNGVVDRFTRLKITDFFSTIYCRERADLDHPNPAWTKKFPMDKIVELPKDRLKPDASIVWEICKANGVSPEETGYVGDNMFRDMLMAKNAGVKAIFAKYGTELTDDPETYKRLIAISHWSDEDVANARKVEAANPDLQPDFVLEKEFKEILNCIL